VDVTLSGLRVLREIAERGTFTAAAAALGYTQSAVSRQVAALERGAGSTLFERRPGGVRLTPAGQSLLRHAAVVLDEMDAAERELLGRVPEAGVVRLGMFPSAGLIVARSLAALRRQHPGIEVTTREGSTPALARGLRAGVLDLAVLSSRPPYRPPDDELPALRVVTLAEGTLLLAVPAGSRLAGQDVVEAEELADQPWIASPSSRGEPALGVWPGLPGRPRIAHSAKDWLTKLHLVAAGCGITTVPSNLDAVMPAGIRLIAVSGLPAESRRMLLAHLPGQHSSSAALLVRALREEAGHLPGG